MSWMRKLHATYEVCKEIRDYVDPPRAEGEEERPALMPVSHTSQQAQIHIVLDGEGNFQRAELWPPKTSFIIPATESSASRTSGEAPHPLADKIHYIAKDYAGGKKNLFPLYEALLKDWCASPFAHPKAGAVYAYIKKGRLVRDLLDSGILHADASGALLTQAPEGVKDSIFSLLVAKSGQRDQGEALVVWSVILPGDMEPRTWKDAALQRSWMDFDASRMEEKALCMVRGEVCAIAGSHPRNIRRPGDGAKLISGNDTSGFTFRGRFLEAAEACSVGYETSHKAHNALRWLLARQGYRNGEQAVLAWAETGARTPNPCEPIPELTEEELFTPEEEVSESEEAARATDADAPPPANLGMGFADRLKKAMLGYRADLAGAQGVTVLTVDAASPGRLSVTYYREQIPGEYLRTLEQWQKDFAWPLPVRLPDESGQGRGKPKFRTVFMPFAPTPDMIARVAYGRRIDDKLRQATIERLLPCVVEKAPLPRDLMESCVRRACNRAALENWEWPEVLGVACAVYKGYYARHRNREDYAMVLEPTRRSRDYLYGRLLAVADYIERTALKQADEQRPTNAQRLMQRFADHPASTWRQLELHLSPYVQRLQSNDKTRGLLNRAQKVLQEICLLFETDDYNSPARLSGEFLLGYHCQMSALYTSSKNDPNSPDQAEQQGEQE